MKFFLSGILGSEGYLNTFSFPRNNEDLKSMQSFAQTDKNPPVQDKTNMQILFWLLERNKRK